MRSERDNRTNSDEQQEFQSEDAFLGDAGEDVERVIDTRIGIKTISTGYCGFTPERAVVAKKLTILGRIGGKMFGVEDQLRNPKEVAEGKAEPDYGKALVGEFYADRYNEDGEVTEYAAGFCYLPGGFQEGVLARFAGLRSDELRAAGMRFSYFIAAEPHDNMRGYRYVVQNAERIEQLEADIGTKLRREAALIASGKAKMADPERIAFAKGAMPLLIAGPQD